MNQNLDKIAELSDELESLAGALQLPMPADFHVQQLKRQLPEKVKELRTAVIAETGENPWNL